MVVNLSETLRLLDKYSSVPRPEEHIDNPEDYADNQDARQHDPRLRPPIRPEELLVDLETGMKNYIANERGNCMYPSPWHFEL